MNKVYTTRCINCLHKRNSHDDDKRCLVILPQRCYCRKYIKRTEQKDLNSLLPIEYCLSEMEELTIEDKEMKDAPESLHNQKWNTKKQQKK